MPQDAQTVRINPDLIPPWTAEYLTECLYKSLCNFFSVPENQANDKKPSQETAPPPRAGDLPPVVRAGLCHGGHPVFGTVLDGVQKGGACMTWAELLLAAMAGAFGGLSAHLAFRYRMREKLEEWLQEVVKEINQEEKSGEL